MDITTIVNSYELSRVLDAMRTELDIRPKNLWRIVLRRAASENLVAMPTNSRLGVWSDPRFVMKYETLRDTIAAELTTESLRSATDVLTTLLERVKTHEHS